MSDPVLKTLGRYEIQGEIGRGTMGVVYKALDPALGRPIALKTVHLAFSIAEADRELYEQRFLSEARIAGALSHPGIVVVHDVGRDPESGTLYIALEYLRGETLEKLTAAGRRMDWREALRISGAVAEGLEHAHSHGVVHRDVKPANIMVLASGEPKIMDFGIAKVPASQLTGAGEFFGTPSYMSPEQAQGEAVDARSDIFSLGCVLYLLLTGKRAFDGPNVPAILSRVTHKEPPPPSSLVPDLPQHIDAVVARALAKEPGNRYADARSLAEDIEDLRAGRPPQHLRGWEPPPPHEGTLVASGPWGKPAAPAPRGPQDTAALPGSTSPPATGTLRRDGRSVLIVGSVAGLAVLLGLVALLRAPSPRPDAATTSSPAPDKTPSDGETPPPPTSPGLLDRLFKKDPAQLEVSFEHSLRSGTLKVWLDGAEDPVINERLGSYVRTNLRIVKLRRGHVTRTLEVSPGEHVVKVEVVADGEATSEQKTGTFESGKKRRLVVTREGIPLIGKKELSLELLP